MAELLAEARALGLERQDAQHLLAACLQRPRSWLLAHDDERVPAGQTATLRDWWHRAANGEPLAYLSGRQAFHGIELEVGPAVLVPRPDTETLVDWALALLQGDGPLAALAQPELLDLGTGSGAIALALKKACPRASVHATDASAAALTQARRNGDRLGLQVQWHQTDWWQNLERLQPDLVVSNPPYIADDDPHMAELGYEPQCALTSGDDGLDDIRSIISGARSCMRPGSWLLLEHGHAQGAAVRQLLHDAGFADVQRRLDLGRRWRCSGGFWPGAEAG